MSATIDKKQTTTVATTDKKTVVVESTNQTAPESTTVTPAEKLKAAIHQLDAQRTELVKSTIENMKPGKSFDHVAIREINKIEIRKNRLIVARFAGLLKKGDPEIQTIVHQIVEL